MNLSQCKVFDWLTFTARIEGGAIVDIYASLYNNTAPGGQTDVLMANAELNDLGYSGTISVYNVLGRLGLGAHDSVYKTRNDSLLDEKLIRSLAGRCTTYIEITAVLKEEHGIKFVPKALAYYMRQHGIWEEIADMKRHRSVRYLVKDGRTTMFNNMHDVVEFLGIPNGTIFNEKNKKHPRFRVFTWKEHVRGDDSRCKI
ncbi:hypothetical protein FC65_GL000652 [Ligilactobacillus acidipiscis DSM 15836]|uniref:Uncharacterized protein n=1 Tax=Ligilactobacillus acidipiscis DSM 15836 TaxID=1423716 RepID=A0ABR5PMK0_9LACO|nr:hypothetical protein [Ligilactobacillus acidipiscis]KRM30316.1 hypothetical protein FC65_GL000652 [Ligilactobacillus acidipiscis DSM 15836]GAW63401.1 hypothetical protein Lacidipiscis_00584 [Ligilactobacillus acidipiscis]GEN19610.1 hypothetical protein LAC02_28910 [Ligilactobacillus acidipiscis]